MGKWSTRAALTGKTVHGVFFGEGGEQICVREGRRFVGKGGSRRRKKSGDPIIRVRRPVRFLSPRDYDFSFSECG